MSRSAVVIGGSGFVGRRLVEMLAGEPGVDRPQSWPRFDSVHVVDVAPWRSDVALATKVTSSIADVRSRDALREVLRGAHTVFHLASLVDVGLKKNPTIDAVNVDGARNVVEVCRELGVPFVVYTSTEDVVLRDTPIAHGDESLPYPEVPLHDYVRTKIEGERIVLAADRRDGLRTCAVRPVHVYGPNDPHAIVTTLRAFASGSVPVLLGDGRARFDVVYVDNVVHAHLLAAAKLHDPATRDVVGGRAYFVGEGNAPNYFEFLRPYAEVKGIRMPRRWLGRRRTALAARVLEGVHRLTGADVPFHRFHVHVICEDFFFSCARAERELGYRPHVAPSEGLRRTIEWVRDVRLEA
ncbi:NAD-dependent epimerase/dehydratase family protein [Sandaracinus amylolyticus]|uniref:NAD(P)H steroid dehydrogenase-like protein n=1 Tax=Sandaracinus amylolyticus TaxID=927083 RepID=A0A0F6VZI9_9BACT|nr:NAD-dependent epimerase/dehydratase family protein [Sandaracinus amylolyticus]AKF03477.1 NAD(P)H steroid dehydrogenase-like protein [Sandaracinus amylolyticus]